MVLSGESLAWHGISMKTPFSSEEGLGLSEHRTDKPVRRRVSLAFATNGRWRVVRVGRRCGADRSRALTKEETGKS